MSSQTKLLLIPCSGEETVTLATKIHDVLRQDYHLEHQVELLYSQLRDKVPKEVPKAHRHPLVGDYFPDAEIQVDIGANELKDVVRGKHVVLIEHLLTPYRKSSTGESVSINDHHMTVRGFLEVTKNVDTLHRTLAAPYLTYVRSHSVEKYKKSGFFQFDSLRTTLIDYQKGGLNSLIAIDPHSMLSAQIAEELGIDFHAINPFQSGRAINPFKLGLSGSKAHSILKRLRPFQERFAQMRKQNQHLYLVSVDDGTEHRVENFTERAYGRLSPEKAYARLAYHGKERVSYDHSPVWFKPFSPIQESSIDKEGTFIIIDDMFASGGTAQRVAEIYKKQGAKRVEVWTSHAVTMPAQHLKANDRSYIDQVVCLDTVPQHPDLKIDFISASADLLAAELYKTHQKLVASR